MARRVKDLEDSTNRLSSGRRVSNARDDVSEFQKIDRLTTKIKSLDRASRNAAEGVNLARQAEAGIDGSVNVLQRIRELAVQAANDLFTRSDRRAMQNEVGYMLRHLEQQAERTSYSSVRLLDGSFVDKSVHVGMEFRNAVDLNIGDARTRELGRYAVLTGAAVTTDALERDTLRVNGITIRASDGNDDIVSTSDRAGSAIAKAAAINDFTRFTGVEAYANRTERAGVEEVAGGTLDLSNYFIINGETFSGFTLQAGTRTTDLINQINARLSETGVLATQDADAHVVLTAEDGRNIAMETVGNAHLVTGLRAGGGQDVSTASLTIYSRDLVRMEDVGGGGAEQRLGYRANQLIGLTETQSVDKIDVTTRLGANLALRIVDRSIEQLSRERSNLGAFSNRMSRTVDALENAVRESYEARSRLQDTDYAHEAAEMAKGNIIRSALTSVLSQSNAQTGKVLNLL